MLGVILALAKTPIATALVVVEVVFKYCLRCRVPFLARHLVYLPCQASKVLTYSQGIVPVHGVVDLLLLHIQLDELSGESLSPVVGICYELWLRNAFW